MPYGFMGDFFWAWGIPGLVVSPSFEHWQGTPTMLGWVAKLWEFRSLKIECVKSCCNNLKIKNNFLLAVNSFHSYQPEEMLTSPGKHSSSNNSADSGLSFLLCVEFKRKARFWKACKTGSCFPWDFHQCLLLIPHWSYHPPFMAL